MTSEEKLKKLKEYLKSRGKAAVAFSGGVDSAFLLRVAREELSADNVLAITVSSQFVPETETVDAAAFCRENGVSQAVIKLDVLGSEEVAANPDNRCYLCKKLMFEKVVETARDHGIALVFDGTNSDDAKDFRPGLAALRELKIESPLLMLGISKPEIRELSRSMGLRVFNKPSFSCLATRLPGGERITAEKLSMIDRAEQILRKEGFSQFRVRAHGEIARIELAESEIESAANHEVRKRICIALKGIGYSYVTLDLEGYRSGSMNKAKKK
ncbi:MAG: ATP-dependent sacrificial sulfur transferase LarE [Succinivibrionaceae bacterium]|nr:ATP-dependent sacrificial sulfur transferase LarE [Succinivibrionaceae bacterium]